MTKTYTVAGYSTLNGVRKLRVANNLRQRIATLTANGHTDIDLQELPAAMTREQIAEWFSGGSFNLPAKTEGIDHNPETGQITPEGEAALQSEMQAQLNSGFLQEVVEELKPKKSRKPYRSRRTKSEAETREAFLARRLDIIRKAAIKVQGPEVTHEHVDPTMSDEDIQSILAMSGYQVSV